MCEEDDEKSKIAGCYMIWLITCCYILCLSHDATFFTHICPLKYLLINVEKNLCILQGVLMLNTVLTGMSISSILSFLVLIKIYNLNQTELL
jgi:hypothetical protein